MKTSLDTVPKIIMDAAVHNFITGCVKFPGLYVQRDHEREIEMKSVPMHEILDVDSDYSADVLNIPVRVTYTDLDFNFTLDVPVVNGIVRVDMRDAKSWLDADFDELGKQRMKYEKLSGTFQHQPKTT